MAIIDARGADIVVDMRFFAIWDRTQATNRITENSGPADFSTYSRSGTAVTFSGIEFEAQTSTTAALEGGVVTSISTDFGGPNGFDLEITGISLNGTGLNNTVHGMWLIVLEGDDTFYGSDNHLTRFIGDGNHVLSGITVTGGDDTFYGSDTANTMVFGDYYRTWGTVTGGNDIMHNVRGFGEGYSYITGDVGRAEAGSVVGGDDEINLRDLAIGVVASGDVNHAINNAVVTGGNDVITQERNATDNDTSVISGDLLFVAAGATAFGGDDMLNGSDSRDIFYGDFQTVDGTTEAGNDTIYGYGGNDVLYGDTGNLRAVGQAGNDVLYGGDGDDVIYGETGLTYVNNATGAAGIGDDQLFGEAGDDTIYGQYGDDLLDGGIGNDILIGGVGTDTLHGGEGNDTLTGGDGADVLNGNDGDDVFDFNGGVDFTTVDEVDGGAGSDTLDYSSYGGGFVANLTNGEFGSSTTVLANLTSVENITAGGGDDTLTGNDEANIITSGTGADTINGLGGDDTFLLSGSNNTVIGGDGDDTFVVLAGASSSGNVLTPGNGYDTFDFRLATSGFGFSSGGLFERYFLNDLNNTLGGGSISNLIYGGGGADTLSGNGGDDELFGESGNDTLNGGTGNDVLNGGLNINTLNGDAGIDTADFGLDLGLVGYALVDLLDTSTDQARVLDNVTDNVLARNTLNSIENLSGGEFDDTLKGDNNDNIVWGNGGNDELRSRDGNDSLYGGDGDDQLDAGFGNDRLTGGEGNDNLFGGDGVDVLDYSASTVDISVDMARGTAIEDVGSATPFNDAFSGIENVEGGAGNDTITGNSGDNVLYGNDGNDMLIGDSDMDWGFANLNIGGQNTIPGGYSGSVTDYLELESANSFGGSEFTFEMLHQASDINSGADIYFSYAAIVNGTLDANAFLVDKVGGDLRFYFNKVNYQTDIDASILADGAVHRLSFSYEVIEFAGGAPSAGQLIVYVDGVELYNSGVGIANGAVPTGGNLIIGQEQDGIGGIFQTSQILSGGIADVRIWDTARTAAEIAADAFAVADNTDPNLIENWVFDDGTIQNVAGTSVMTLTGGEIIGIGAGNDTLNGGAGNDTLIGGGGIDILNGGDGDDTLRGDAQNDILNGDAGNDTLLGGLGADILNGGTGNDLLLGGNRNDTLDGGEGNDRAFGGNADDTVMGGIGDDILRGGDQNDSLDGGEGNDFLFGGTGIDNLVGGAGNDTLIGRGGFDVLNGGEGDDILTGGFNADVFVFEGVFGNDIITDYSATSDAEDIDLSGVASIVNFTDLMNNHATQVGSDVVIDDLLGNTITLQNVDISDLNVVDFIF